MSRAGQARGLEIADRAVAMALEAGATQAKAVLIRSSSALTRFANNEIHQNVSEDDTVVNLRFVDGQRIGVASGNRHDDASLQRLTESASAIARLQPEQVLRLAAAATADSDGRWCLLVRHGRGRP